MGSERDSLMWAKLLRRRNDERPRQVSWRSSFIWLRRDSPSLANEVVQQHLNSFLTPAFSELVDAIDTCALVMTVSIKK
jgi:hypothetical protein